jgi:hypothetical protein
MFPPKQTRHTALCRLFAIYAAPLYPDRVAAANRYIPICRPQTRSEMPPRHYKSTGVAPEPISTTGESGLTPHSAPLRRPAASQLIGCCLDRMEVCIDKPNARLWPKLPKKDARAQHLNQVFLIGQVQHNLPAKAKVNDCSRSKSQQIMTMRRAMRQ